MSHAVLRALGGGGLGAAAWFSLGTLTIAGRGEIAGLLPSASLLALFVLAGAVAVTRLRRLPLSTTVFPAVLIVPWIAGDRVPLSLLWSGPAALVVWAAFAVALARALKWPSEIGRARAFVALTLAGTMSAFAAGALRHGITGDEPHYLLIAQSILLDGDLDLANDYDPVRHRAIYPGVLAPRHTVLAMSGKEYSFHGTGVAALALPGFAVAGLAGAQALFLGIAVAGAIVLWIAARELVNGAGAAWAAAAALVFQLPFLGQAAAIYPDSPAAAITSLSLWTLARVERSGNVSIWKLVACASCLSLLPFLHIRLTILAVVFAVTISAAMWRGKRPAGDIVAFLAVPAIAATLFFASTFVMFETIDPTRIFRGQAAGSVAAMPTGVLGLLFDHQYGLLIYAPIFALAAVAWTALRRLAPLVAWAAAIATIATLLTGAAFVWWGGTTSPARFLVPVLPALALCVGAWWPRASSHARAAAVVLMACSASLAALAAALDDGRYVTAEPDGRSSVFAAMNHALDLPGALPSLFRPGTTPGDELVIALIWVASAIVVLRFVGRWRAEWALIAWITIAAASTWMVRGENPVTLDRSQRALLQASASPFLSTPWLDRRPASSIEAVLQTLAFEGELAAAPAGRYSVEGAVTAANVSVAIGTEQAALTWPANATDDERVFSLPVAVERIRVSGGRLRPLSLRNTPGTPRAQYAVRSGDALLFVWDTPQREQDGLWVAADRPVRVLCAQLRGDAPCGALQFRLAERDASVQLTTSNGVTRILIRKANDEDIVDLPATLEPVVIEATGPPSRTRAVFVTAVPRRATP